MTIKITCAIEIMDLRFWIIQSPNILVNINTHHLPLGVNISIIPNVTSFQTVLSSLYLLECWHALSTGCMPILCKLIAAFLRISVMLTMLVAISISNLRRFFSIFKEIPTSFLTLWCTGTIIRDIASKGKFHKK